MMQVELLLPEYEVRLQRLQLLHGFDFIHLVLLLAHLLALVQRHELRLEVSIKSLFLDLLLFLTSQLL